MDSNGTLSTLDERHSDSSCQELFIRDALGTVVNELFVDFASLFGIANNCNPKNFNLFSVFVKDSGNHFSYVGHLGPNGGILLRDGADITTTLRPHLHRSIRQNIDQYLTAMKHPFTRNITELTASKLTQRPEGKYFSWIDMGMSQIHYIDRDKLAGKLQHCAVDLNRPCLRNVGHLYIVHKNCISERLHYYSSKLYQCSSWMGKDHAAIEAQIKHVTKSEPCIRSDDNDAPRAFSLCKIAISKDGRLGIPDYHVMLLPTNPHEQSLDPCVFIAEELDFKFVSAVISNVKAMKTREILHSVLQDIYVHIESYERSEVLKFLQKVSRKFQTENQCIQMVDFSFAVSSIPTCLSPYPTILSRMLRAAGIVITEASSQDSDDEEKAEPQIVFQPANCQEYLRLIEFLLTLLVKGSITDKQCETATQLLDTEVTSLQELFYTQMCCICAPWKSLNPKEEPMVSLWKRGTRTRQFLESLGLREKVIDDQRVVLCPENCLLLNVLSIFFKDVD